jgi:hypothetical protein
VILGLLIVAEILLRRPMYSLFGEAMMFVYYIALYPGAADSARLLSRRSLVRQRVHAVVHDLRRVVEGRQAQVTLILVLQYAERARGASRSRPNATGEARRLLKDRVKAHDLNMGGGA